ncbi:hypothetical protein YC2023_063027 [Brassica napus]
MILEKLKAPQKRITHKLDRLHDFIPRVQLLQPESLHHSSLCSFKPFASSPSSLSLFLQYSVSTSEHCTLTLSILPPLYSLCPQGINEKTDM